MQQFPQLEQDKYYHIYNRGINGEKIFLCSDNYLYFLKLYLKYIEPIAYTFAYALMPNHFHFLVRIKELMNEDYLKYMVYYIHNNPIHHKFTKDLTEYQWTSFSSILSEKQTHIERMEVLSWFEDKENFEFFHHQDHNMDRFSSYLID